MQKSSERDICLKTLKTNMRLFRFCGNIFDHYRPTDLKQHKYSTNKVN